MLRKTAITLCLELLNSVDDSHPMKGHPGYQGDDLDFCIEAIKQVGSPNLKLLFDIYHVQIMHGDIIRNIGKYKEYIGHYHTAGNPGRGELDDTQEINYPAVMRAILATGFRRLRCAGVHPELGRQGRRAPARRRGVRRVGQAPRKPEFRLSRRGGFL